MVAESLPCCQMYDLKFSTETSGVLNVRAAKFGPLLFYDGLQLFADIVIWNEVVIILKLSHFT